MDTKKALEKVRNYISGETVSVQKIEEAVDVYLQATGGEKYDFEEALRNVRRRAMAAGDDDVLQVFADKNLVEKLTTVTIDSAEKRR